MKECTAPWPQSPPFGAGGGEGRARLVINLGRNPEEAPFSGSSIPQGLRLRGRYVLGRGQQVELVLDEEEPTLNAVAFSASAKQVQARGEVGLKGVNEPRPLIGLGNVVEGYLPAIPSAIPAATGSLKSSC